VNHPLEVLQPDRAPKLITPYPIKERLLKSLGVDLLVALPFTPSLAEMEAEAFVEEILWKKLRAEFLCLGFDFRFGRGRRGTPDLLRKMAKALGFEVEVLPPVTVDGTVVKSTIIRDLLQQGKVGEAARYLTRPYAALGEIIPGAGRGRGLGFATANLLPPHDLLIPDGVYAGRAYVDEGGHDAAINVGVAPTFGAGGRRVEIHLLDVQEDRAPGYGQAVLVTFQERIRDETHFASPEALQAQVARDIQRVREILSQPSAASADWALLGSGSCASIKCD
jgi:riboflavin kinase/FMN adenylyltransferase